MIYVLILGKGHIFWTKYLFIVKQNLITFYQVGHSPIYHMGWGYP